MATGGVFTLITRDERFDRYFQATRALSRRLAAAARARAAAGEPCAAPTFADVERTHVLFVNSQYRPFVSVGSEYTRVKATGATALGPAGSSLDFAFPAHGHFVSDMAFHVRVRPLGSAAAAAAGDAPTAAAPLYRYCALPGARLFRSVAFSSGGVDVDSYTPDDVAARAKFFLGADHRGGWERAVGQQEAREATFLGNGFTGTLAYRDGPQTPKLYQEGLDLFVPCEFDFCRGPDRALLNELLPASQRRVRAELAPLDDFLRAFVPGAEPGTLVQVPLPFASLAVEVDLYINHLYLNPDVHALFAARVGFSLVRVHRRQTTALVGAEGRVLLDGLRFPVEYMAMGVRPRAQAADFDRWHLMGAPRARASPQALLVPAVLWNVAQGAAQLVVRRAAEASTLESVLGAVRLVAKGTELFPLLPQAFFGAYLPLRYRDGGAGAGGAPGPAGGLVVSPADVGAFLVSFCLQPGGAGASGYHNLSAGRELYLEYALTPEIASALPPGSTYELVVSASALNFLVRHGDHVFLKYSV